MTPKRTRLSGRAGAVTGGGSTANARDNAKEATYWVSHRGGPFLVHKNGEGCESQTMDNVGYLDVLDTAIDQGFMPCPKCMN